MDEDGYRILRKLVKLFLLKEGKLVSGNEFNRGIGAMAQKLNESADDLLAVIVPIIEELCEEMTASKKPDTGDSRVGIPNSEVFDRR